MQTLALKHPFQIRGVNRQLPAGAYEIITEEETIEGLSLPTFRRTATIIVMTATVSPGDAMEMISIGSFELSGAQRIDASRPDGARQASRCGRSESDQHPSCFGRVESNAKDLRERQAKLFWKPAAPRSAPLPGQTPLQRRATC